MVTRPASATHTTTVTTVATVPTALTALHCTHKPTAPYRSSSGGAELFSTFNASSSEEDVAEVAACRLAAVRAANTSSRWTAIPWGR